MRIPEYLFSSTPKSDVSIPIQILNRAIASLSQAAVFVESTIYTVGNDEILVLASAAAYAQAGAAQTCNYMQLAAFDQTNTAIATIKVEFLNFNAGRTQGALNWGGEIWLPPNTTIRMAGNFSAGAAANIIQVPSISGLIIPRGNTALA